MGDGSIIPAATAAAADDDKASSGLQRIVWFRQMIHRWQSSSSNTTTAKRSPSIAGGDVDPAVASTDNEDATLAAAATDIGSDERNPLLPRMVVVEERCHTHGHGCRPEEEAASEGGGDSPMTPATPGGLPADVPRGCCPVYVGAERRRFVVPTAYLGMPVFRRLLEKAEEEFEFHYHGGALTIPCDTEAFKYIFSSSWIATARSSSTTKATRQRQSMMMMEGKVYHRRSRRLDDNKLTLSTAFYPS